MNTIIKGKDILQFSMHKKPKFSTSIDLSLNKKIKYKNKLKTNKVKNKGA